MNMATMMVIKAPGDVPDIFIYQSGANIRTTITDKIMGIPNKKAMGRPLLILLKKELSLSRTCSQ
jgi:hypothetical protein